MSEVQSILLDASKGRGHFASKLQTVTPKDAQRWVWLSYDQLNLAFLERLKSDGEELGVILILSLIHI